MQGLKYGPRTPTKKYYLSLYDINIDPLVIQNLFLNIIHQVEVITDSIYI